VRIRWIAVAATTLAVAGCWSGPPERKLAPDELIAGTAQVTVNGQDTGTTVAVQCTPAGSLTTIMTGDKASGVSAPVSSKDALTAEAVGIGDLDGFNTANPSFRTSGTFAIKVVC